MSKPGFIYTHDEAALIVDIFENILDECNNKIPSPEDDEREPDNDAKLYGSVYSRALDEVEDMIYELLRRHKDDTIIVVGEFSGTI